ncbi:MAG: 16S rRNA (guanine(966)-N(2))-methyltransferase RsmD [candidate division WOR-3 bacterium]|nr:16S rRNA (guanine(966)-N(2))-methyltransferase RsmD [candidate division WOR-3 bacterium]
MKITSGEYKGRCLKVAKSGIRPTKSIVRSAIFNVIGERVIDATVIDIFAGTGAIGIEALSRGAKFCVFIEKNPQTLLKNVERLNLWEKVRIIKQDFRPGLKKLKGMEFDIAFIDPPYRKEYLSEVLRLLHFLCIIKKGGLVVAEYSAFLPQSFPDGYCLLKTKKYGDTIVSFLELKE